MSKPAAARRRGRWFGTFRPRGEAVRGSSRRDYFQRSELGFMILNSIPLASCREAGFTSGSLNSCHIGDGVNVMGGTPGFGVGAGDRLISEWSSTKTWRWKR
jgi:hypothetical protein